MKKNIKLRYILIGFVLLLAFIVLSASGQADKEQPADTAKALTIQQTAPNNRLAGPEYSTTGVYFRLLFAVFIVAVFAFLIFWLAKQFKYKVTGGKTGKIEIVETAYLANRKTLHIVKVAKRSFLIASTNDSITKLADLSEWPLDAAVNAFEE